MKINSDIKNIIFDLGGVILNIDYNLTIKEFKKLGINNFENIFSQFKQSNFSDKFETGDISEHEFYKEIKKATNTSFTFNEFKKAWNAMLLDLPKDRIALLKKLSTDYRLFLFSNTNETHYKKFHENVENDFNEIFEKTYYSHLFGNRKPTVNSFQKIVQENNLKVKETLFIDDSKQHIIGAEKAGIKALLIDKSTIESIFK